MVEQRSPKPTVEGSSPSAPARHNEAPLGVSGPPEIPYGLFWPIFSSSFIPLLDSLTPQPRHL